jgi:RHS repeat-associated protein
MANTDTFGNNTPDSNGVFGNSLIDDATLVKPLTDSPSSLGITSSKNSGNYDPFAPLNDETKYKDLQTESKLPVINLESQPSVFTQPTTLKNNNTDPLTRNNETTPLLGIAADPLTGNTTNTPLFFPLSQQQSFSSTQIASASSPFDAPKFTSFALVNDTAPGGTTNTDKITFDPTIRVTVPFPQEVTEWKAGFNNTPEANYVNILPYLQQTGITTFNRALLETINGGSFPDGRYALYILTRRTEGQFVSVSKDSFSFTFDSTAPTQPTFNLDAASDSGVIGDRQTQLGTVTLAGQTAANTTVTLQQGNTVTTSDSSGKFTFANVPLVIGGNSFTAIATDIAGNTNLFSTIITRQPQSSITLTNNTIAENSLTGTVIGQLSTNNQNSGNSNNYELVNGAGGRFRLVNNQLQVADSTLLDFESNNQHVIIVSNTDTSGVSTTQEFTISVTNINEAPIFTSTPTNTNISAGNTFTYNITTIDPDAGDTRILSAVGLPSWLNLTNPGNGTATLTGTPNNSQLGLFNIALTATDAGGLKTTQNIIISNEITLAEQSNFVPQRIFPLVVPATPSILSFKINPTFDLNDLKSINDAFEVALVDKDGNSVVHTIAKGRDAFFNLTEGEGAAMGTGVIYNATTKTVSLNLMGVKPGEAQLIFRLVNNDNDTTTNVKITDFALTNAPAGTNTPAQSTFANEIRPGATPNFNLLTDVSNSLVAEYGRTSYNTDKKLLYADISIRNTGTYSVNVPLLVAVKNINDPSVVLPNPDGVTADGVPYYDFSSLVAEGKLDQGGETLERALVFYNPNNVQFKADLVVLAQLNKKPIIDSKPIVEIIGGQQYRYDVNATDSNGDTLTYKLLVAPTGMTIDDNTGLITWNTTTSNKGNQSIIVEVSDSRGGLETQRFNLSIIDAPPNRPPVFTTTPKVDATINAQYKYDADATDPDSDNLTYNLALAPEGMVVNPNTGEITWTPGVAKVLGNIVVERIAPGERDTFSFGGVKGEYIYFDSLIGNDSQTFELFTPSGNKLIDSNTNYQGFVILTETGNYKLVVSGSTGEYGFSLIDSKAAPVANFEQNITGVLTPGSEDDVYRFNGSAGQRLYFATLSNNRNLDWVIYNANNQAIASTVPGNPWGDLEVELLTDGQYFLVLRGKGNYNDNIPYSFRILRNEANSTPLALGTNSTPNTVSGSILKKGEQDVYTFAGTRGQRLYLDTISATSGIRATIITPSGDKSGYFTSYQLNGSDSNLFSLEEDGNYRLVIEGDAGATGEYSFNLLNATQANLISLDTDVSNRLVPGKETHLYRLSTTVANQRLYLDSLLGSQDASWTLYGSSNQIVRTGTLNTDLEAILPTIDTYTLAIQSNSNNPIDYQFRVVSHNPLSTPLSFGSTISGEIAKKREQDIYTFSSSVDTRLFLDALQESPNINARLVSTSGVEIFNTKIASDAQRRPVILPEGGNYQLIIDCTGEVTGNYSFRLHNLSTATTLATSSVTNGTLNPGSSTNLFKFSGNAGNRLYLDSQIASPNATWLLYGPGNQLIDSKPLSDDYEVVLPSGGMYYLMLRGDGSATPINYRIQVVPSTPSATNLTLGSLVSSSISVLGEQDIYTFNANTVGQRLYLDSRVGNSNITARLISPSGVSVWNGATTTDSTPIVLLETGAYRLIIDGNSDTTGAYSFLLSNLASASSLAPSTTISGSLSASETRLYSFNGGTAGQRLRFDSLTATQNADWVLYAPDGSIVNQATLSNDFEVLLPTNGSYILALRNNSASISSSFSFRVDNISSPSGTNSGLGTINSGTITTGQINHTTFTARAGTFVYFDSQISSLVGNGVTARLLDPSNNQIFSTNAAVDSNLIQLQLSGSYTLRLEGNGGYRYQVIDLNATTDLSLNTLTDIPLNPSSAKTYKFNGVVGQQIFYDALNSNNPNATVRLFTPSGSQILSTQAQLDSELITLKESGTYFLIFSNDSGSNTSVNFRLLDNSASGATSLTLDAYIYNTLSSNGFGTDLYRFNGTAGQYLYFDSIVGTAPNTWTLYGPSGQLLERKDLDKDFEITLPGTGQYVLANTGKGSIGSYYESQIIASTTTPTTISLGSIVSNAISKIGEQDNYTLNATTAGQRVFFDGISGDNTNVRLVSPSGVEIFNLRSTDNRELFNLQETGNYRVVVDAPETATGSYSFRLLNATSATTLPLGSSFQNVTVAANQTQLYSFSSTTNQYLYFENTSTNPESTWTLYGPGNQAIATGLSGTDRELTITTGNYVLALNGVSSAATNYQFRAVTSSLSPSSISLGISVGGSINAIGEQDTYTFSAQTSGQRVFFDSLTGSSTIGVRIISPSGAVVYDRKTTEQSEPFTLYEAGTYRVVVDGEGKTTGNYSFRLLDLAQATNLTLNISTSGTLNPGSQAQLYKFTGTKGQHLYFDLFGEWNTNNASGWALYGPNNQLVVSNFNRQSGTSDLETKLTGDGTYTLMIGGKSNVITAESFQFRVTTPQALTLGSTVPGSINISGKQDTYTFDGRAGTRLFFDSLGGSSNVTAKLFSPSGKEVTTWSANTDSNEPLSLLETGGYRLVISANNNTTGNYSFRLVDLGSAPTLILNTPIAGRLEPGFETDFYQFYAAVGQKFNFDLTATQWTNANWVLYAPSGAAIATPISTSPDFEVTPEKAGTYVLAVRGSSSTLIDYNFKVTRSSVDGSTSTSSTSNILIPGLGEIDTNLDELGTYRVLLEARDGRGGKADQSFKIRVGQETRNNSPQFISDPVTLFGLNETVYKYKVKGIDPDNDSLSYRLTVAPTGAFINAETGEITWSPTRIGNYDFQVQLTDGRGGFAKQDFQVEAFDRFGKIRGVVWNDENLNGILDTKLIQGDMPDVVMVIDNSGSTGGREVNWTTAELNDYLYNTNLSILDTELASVVALNQQLIDRGFGETARVAVVVFSSDASILDMNPVAPGIQMTTTPTADVNGNGILDIREVLNIDLGGGTDFTPPLISAENIFNALNTQVGKGNIIFLSDGVGLLEPNVVSRLRTRGINLKAFGIGAGADINQLKNIDPQASAVMSVQELINIFSGFDGRYFLEPGLANVKVYLDLNNNGLLDNNEPNSVTLADDPTTEEVETGWYSFSNLLPGTYNVRSVLPNGYTQTAPTTGFKTFTITGTEEFRNGNFGLSKIATEIPNTQPRFINSAPTNAKVGETFSYKALATDPDRDALIYDLPSKPDGMTVDTSSGVVVWTPKENQVGKFDAILRVRDNRGGIDLQYFQVNVTPQNRAPVFTDIAPNILRPQIGKQFQYQARGVDLDGDTIIYEIVSNTTNSRLPSGVLINRDTGLVTWTPTNAQQGGAFISGLTSVVEPWQILIRATDGKGGEALQTLNLIVEAARLNQAPQITSKPRTSNSLGNNYFYKINAVDPDGDALTYTLDNAPTGMEINNGVLVWTPANNQFGSNSVVVRVSDGTVATTQSFSINVGNAGISTEPINRAPEITSTPKQVTYLGWEYKYDLSGSDADGDLLLWSIDKAPSGMVIDTTTGALRWKPTANQIGEHTVAVRLTDALGQYVGQEFTLNVAGVNTAPQIVSTPITRASQNQRYTYTVVATDPENDVLKYSIDSTSRNKGITIDGNGVIQWTPTTTQVGSHNVEVTVSDTQGATVSQSYAITVGTTAINNAPSITSTPVFVTGIGSNITYRYQVVVTDSDAGDTLTYQLLSGPTGMSINSTGLLTWTNPTAGTYQIAVGAVDRGGLGAAQKFTLTARSNNAPVINSTAVTNGTPGTAYSYDVKAVDVDGDKLTYSLDTTSLSKGMTLDNLGRLRWNPSISNLGSHNVVLSVADGNGGSTNQSYSLVVAGDTIAPKVSLIALNNTANLGDTITFQARATDNIKVAGLQLLINGTNVVLDANGIGTVKATTAGTVRGVAKATDTAGNIGQATFDVVVINPSDVNPPTVSLDLSAIGDGFIKAPTDIRGTITDDTGIRGYKLIATPIDGGESKVIFTVDKSNQNIKNINGVLGKFDPSLLQNDSYVLRLEVEDIGGHISYTEQTVNVAGDLKLGNFRLSFTDLTVPVTGIPITLTRTYDTLTSGTTDDFGYGWRMEFRDTDLRTGVGKPSEEDEILGRQQAFKDGTKVYITLPGGKREAFTFKPKMVERLDGQSLGVFAKYFYTPEFVADKGVTSKLTVESNFIRRDSNSNKYYGFQGNPYNPADQIFGSKYTLTTKEGVEYEIDAATGDLLTVTDTNRNKLTYTDEAITSSTGQKVTFERDAEGRITSVKDPMGELIKYKYDALGDLISVTDRENNTTRMEYNQERKHYLDKIIDPLGRTGVRNEYGADGRLSELVDVNGKKVEMTYDTNASRQVVKDARGYETAYIYDDRGNVLSETNAKGTIIRTYDADNNTLSETDEDGVTTEYTYDSKRNLLTIEDEDGNITRMTYDGNGRATTIVSPTGLSTSAKYDSRGNLIESIDADGLKTAYQYSDKGQLRFQTAPDGQVTEYNYDRFGNPNVMVDSRGNKVSSIYDSSGRLKQVTAKVITEQGIYDLTTSYVYDKEGRTTQVTDQYGNVRKTEYDAKGQIVFTEDGLGNRTQYIRDNKGQITDVILPDNTPDNPNDNPRTKTKYDEAGNIIEETSATGLTTRYIYDELNRLVSTILPDLTPGDNNDNPKLLAKYTAAGRLKEEVDIFGNSTKYWYDSLGRLEREQDVLGNYTKYTYNIGGQVETVTDIKNRTTRFVYDEFARAKETIFFDGSKSKVTYDQLSRVKTQTNQLGQTTAYEYDEYGRVKAGINALGDRSEYAYDKRGNLIRVTDALQHSTSFEYDKYGRQVATIAHTGEQSEVEYDQYSRVISKKDANQSVTKHEYNNLSQLVSIELADNSRTNYTYDIYGRLIGVEDALQNRTQYEYDNFNRQTATILPMGQRNKTVYNNLGQVVSSKDFNGDIINYAYDQYGRSANKSFSNPTIATVSYSYDPITSQLATVTDGRGVTRYSYDNYDRVASITNPDSQVINYGYDVLGNLTAQTTSAGTINYTYDALNRLDKVTEALRTVADYDYDKVGNLIRTILGNGTQENRLYDERNRLKYLDNRDASNNVISSYAYILDAVGNRQKVVENTGRVVEYTYDSLYRLKSEKITDLNNGNRLIGYNYDLVGNRLNRTDSVEGLATYIYDRNNHLTQETQGNKVTNFTYDNNGSMKSRITGGETVNYRWINDGENRLVGVTKINSNGQQNLEYIYDASGDRVASIIDGVRTNYLVDPMRGVSQVLMEYEANGQITADYTYGLGLIKSDAYGGLRLRAGNETFYHVDGLGSTRLLTNTTGQVVDRYTYDAYGRLLSRTGTNDNPYQFAGEHRDSETGLDYLRARYYDPNLGRFISKDAFAGSLSDPMSQHDYQYAHANPVRYTDPTGYFSIGGALAVIGILASIAAIGAGTGNLMGAYASGATEEELWNMTDSWVAGFAHVVSLGGSTWIRNNRYGESAAKNHSGVMWNSGQLAGVGVGMIIGGATPEKLTFNMGRDKWIATTYEVANTAAGAWQTGSHFSDGKLEWTDAFNLAPLAPFSMSGGVKRFLGGAMDVNGKIRGWGRIGIKASHNELPNVVGTCFVAGTKVLTPVGKKTIESLAVGDIVTSADPTLNKVANYKIKHHFIHTVPIVLEIDLESATITCSPEHPFWVVGQGWQEAEELKPGFLLLTKDGLAVPIISIRRREGCFTVYNIEVEEFHTYYVSDLGILVHNKSAISRLYTPDGYAIPFGFKDVNDYQSFNNALKAGLPDGTQAVFQGSAVTGYGFKTGQPFDVGRISDFDIGLTNKGLFNKAKDLGYKAKDGTRIGPLKPAQLDALGLSDTASSLTEQAGRPVNFMLYNTLNDALKRPSIYVD